MQDPSHWDFSWLRAKVAAALRGIRRLRFPRPQPEGTTEAGASRIAYATAKWAQSALRRYVLFWCRKRTIQVWLGACGVLFAFAVYYDLAVASPHPQPPPVYEALPDGLWKVTVQKRIGEGFYTHYRLDNRKANPGDLLRPIPSCHVPSTLGQEARKIALILVKAPLTAFIGAAEDIPKLEFFQWFVVSRWLGKSWIGAALDQVESASAHCELIFAPLPDGARLPSGLPADATLTMRNDPMGTDGCATDRHVVPLDGRSEAPCGWMVTRKPEWATLDGKPGVKLEVVNWLHDDWPVDRVFEFSVIFMLPANSVPPVQRSSVR